MVLVISIPNFKVEPIQLPINTSFFLIYLNKYKYVFIMVFKYVFGILIFQLPKPAVIHDKLMLIGFLKAYYQKSSLNLTSGLLNFIFYEPGGFYTISHFCCWQGLPNYKFHLVVPIDLIIRLNFGRIVLVSFFSLPIERFIRSHKQLLQAQTDKATYRNRLIGSMLARARWKKKFARTKNVFAIFFIKLLDRSGLKKNTICIGISGKWSYRAVRLRKWDTS